MSYEAFVYSITAPLQKRSGYLSATPLSGNGGSPSYGYDEKEPLRIHAREQALSRLDPTIRGYVSSLPVSEQDRQLGENEARYHAGMSASRPRLKEMETQHAQNQMDREALYERTQELRRQAAIPISPLHANQSFSGLSTLGIGSLGAAALGAGYLRRNHLTRRALARALKAG